MVLTAALNLQLVLASPVISGTNCDLVKPPVDAGETQAHGVILYIYPRSNTIDKSYTDCQNQWFLDEDHFRKLSIVYYMNGAATSYDNLNIRGDISYRCQYVDRRPTDSSDRRCPDFERLMIKTYQPGCYSNSELNNSGSFDLISETCEIEYSFI